MRVLGVGSAVGRWRVPRRRPLRPRPPRRPTCPPPRPAACPSPRFPPRPSNAYALSVNQGQAWGAAQHGGRHACVGRGFRRWKMRMGKISTFTLPSSAAPSKSCATPCATSRATSWKMARAAMNTYMPASSAAPERSSAASRATSCAMSCDTLFTCLSFTCSPRAARGAACVCWAWVLPLEDGACHDEHLHARVLRGARYASRRVLCHVLRHALRHTLHVLVLHVSPKGTWYGVSLRVDGPLTSVL